MTCGLPDPLTRTFSTELSWLDVAVGPAIQLPDKLSISIVVKQIAKLENTKKKSVNNAR